MKKMFLPLLLAGCLSATAQHRIEKVWETDSVLAVPESVLVHGNTLFVSQIDGAPWEADGKGSIAQLDRSGKVLKNDWVTGLHAPKGMAIQGGKLYVADMNTVVAVDLASGKITDRLVIDTAKGLNDVTGDGRNTLYVSDSRTGTVYRFNNGKPEVFLSDLRGVNGLKWTDGHLFILTAKDVLKVSPGKQKQTIGEMEFGGDGIEPVGSGDFVTTTWGGIMYYFGKDGKKEILLDTREARRNTADIGYDPVQKIIYVPTFNARTVVAYRLR